MELIEMIEDIYGEYHNDFVREIIIQYLDRKFSDIDNKEVLKKLLHGYQNIHKTPPDVFDIASCFKIHDSVLKQQASLIFDKLIELIDVYADIVFDDPAIQAGLNAMGGWVAFCNHKTSMSHFLRQDFIKAYILEFRHPAYKIKLNRGIASWGNNKVICLGSLESFNEILSKYNMEGKNIIYIDYQRIIENNNLKQIH